jgi:hypothetical protein
VKTLGGNLMNSEINKLALDFAKGQVEGNKTAAEVDAVLRAAFLERIGVESITHFNDYRIHKDSIFAIITEVVSPIINEYIDTVVGRFADVRNVGWGDTNVFDIENPELFEVSVIADGTGNLNRQRIQNGKMTVPMETMGVKIYDEFYRFLAGRINWSQLVDKVAKSYEKKLSELAYDTIYSSYNNLDAEFKFTGSFDEDEVLRVLANVEGLYGSAMLVGTKPALAKMKLDYIGGSGKDDYNAIGYHSVFRGYDVMALTNSFKPGTYEFALSNTDLLVLPAADHKIIKIVHEGDVIVIDEQNVQGDLSIEHTFIKKAGVGIALTDKFGILRFS